MPRCADKNALFYFLKIFYEMMDHVAGKKSNERIVILDVLRGIAALSVVIYHLSAKSKSVTFVYGTTGVDLFFIISGFVILMTLEKTKKGIDFITGRFSRLYPTYWTAVIFTFTLQAITYKFYFHQAISNEKWIQGLVNLTMFQTYFGIHDLDGPYWTLILEMSFYIFMYVLFVTKQLNNIINISLIMMVLAFVMRYSGYMPFAKIWSVICYWLPFLSYLPLFISGIMFYNTWKGNRSRKVYFIVFISFVYQAMGYTTRDIAVLGISQPEYVGLLVLYFSLFFLFVNDKLNWIAFKPLKFLGTISYALYVCHGFFSNGVMIPFLNNILHLNFWVAFSITFIMVLAIASAITFWIEIPARKKLRTLLSSAFSKN